MTAIALATALLAASPAAAQSPAEQAETLNKQGKELFAAKDFEGAYARFREAAALSPEGRYYFNMCYALGTLRRYEEAIQKCEQVEAAGADAALLEKTQSALASLREKAAAERAVPASTGATGPAGEGAESEPASGRDLGRNGGPYGPPPPPPHGGPDPFVARVSGPADSYTWSIGGMLGVLGNLNVGREVDTASGPDREMYGPGGAELRLFANFIVSEAARLGLQASIGASALAPGEDNEFDDNLVLADIGGAIFLHLPLFEHFFVTPLAGPALSVQRPQERSQGFIGFGARGELGFTFVFGPRGEHSFSVVPALNIYFPAGGEVEGRQPEDLGLDVTRATFGVSAGYAYRFSTPFGTVPIITLE